MRKKDEALRGTLLELANRIECEEGIDAINIRRLASDANIAVGTVYNYFDSKQEVLLALTEEYWKSALLEMRANITATRFSQQVDQMIVFLRGKMNDCAEVLMRSLHDDAATGKIRMAKMQDALRNALIERLNEDAFINAQIWNPPLTKEAFTGFVLSNIVLLLQQKDTDAKAFITIIDKILYQGA